MDDFFKKPKLTPPNEQGFQFGIDEGLTEYARSSQYNDGNELPAINYHVLRVYKDDSLVSMLVVDSKDNRPVKECKGLEACATYLDMLKLAKKMKRI